MTMENFWALVTLIGAGSALLLSFRISEPLEDVWKHFAFTATCIIVGGTMLVWGNTVAHFLNL